MANFAIRYEHLEKDFSTLKNLFNFPIVDDDDNMKNYNAKSTFRPKESRNWQTFYNEDTIELVRECCADEIYSFNYSFEGDDDLRGPYLQ